MTVLADRVLASLVRAFAGLLHHLMTGIAGHSQIPVKREGRRVDLDESRLQRFDGVLRGTGVREVVVAGEADEVLVGLERTGHAARGISGGRAGGMAQLATLVVTVLR